MKTNETQASEFPAAHLKELLETSDAMMESVLIGDRQRTLDTLTRCIHDNLHAESCAIYLVDEDSRESMSLESSFTDLTQGAMTGPQVKISIRSKEHGGLTGHIAQAKQIVRMSRAEMESNPFWARKPPEHLKAKTCHSLLAIPLLDRKGKLLGLLKAENKKNTNGSAHDDTVFTELEEDIARILANKLRIAIENLRTVEFFQKLIQDVQGNETYDLILQAILRRVVNYVRVDRGDLALWSEQKRTLVHAAVVGQSDDKVGHKGSSPGRSLVAKTWSGRIDLVEYQDVSKEADYHECNPRTRSEVLLKLKLDDNRAIGILNLESFDLDGFDEQDIKLLESISGAVAVAVHMAAKQTRLSGLLDGAVNPQHRSDDFLNEILDAVQEIYGFDGGVIHIASEDGTKLVCSAYMDSEPQPFGSFDPKQVTYAREDASIVGKVFREKQPYFSPNARQDFHADQANPLIQSINGAAIGLPLLWGTKPLGAMLVWSRQNRSPAPVDVPLLVPFASLAAARIAGAESHDSQRHLAALQAIGNIPPEMPASLDDDKYLRWIFLGIESAGFERAQIFKFHAEVQKFECIASFGPKFDNAFRGKSTTAASNLYDQDIIKNYPSNPRARVYDPAIPQSFGPDPYAAEFGNPPELPWAAVPLILNGTLYGQITADNKFSRKTISPEHLEYLTLIATEISKALSTSETLKFYKSVVEDLPANVTHKNRDGRLIYANAAFLKTCGMSMAELMLKTDADLYPTDLAKKYQFDDSRILSGLDEKIEADEEHEIPGGARICVHVVKTPLKDVHGLINGVQVVFWNSADADLAALMKIIPDSIYFKDKNSKFRQISQSMSKRLGLKSPEEAVGRTDEDFFLNAADKLADEKKIMESEESINKIESEIFGACSILAADFIDLPLLVNKLKQPVDSVSCYFAKLLSVPTVSILTKYNGSGVIPIPLRTAIVSDFNRLIGGQMVYNSQHFSGVHLRTDTTELLAKNPLENDLRRRLNRFLIEDAFPHEIVRSSMANYNPRTLWVSTIKAALKHGDKIVGTCGISRDVTELMRLKDVERLAWGVNYSLRTRAGILENRFSLLSDKLDPKFKDTLVKIKQSIKFFSRAGNLSSKILRFQHGPERARVMPPLELTQVIHSLLEVLDDSRIEFQPQSKFYARIDRADFEDLMAELLINACDFAAQEKGRVTVSMNINNEWLVIDISDNGPGIHPAIRPFLFEMFKPYPASRMGLGLAYVKNLLNRYEGNVEEIGQAGKGATFRLKLPAATTKIN